MFVFHLGDNGLTLHNSWTGRTNHLLSFLSPFLHFYNSKGSVYACFLPQDFDFHFLLHFLSVLCLVWFSSPLYGWFVFILYFVFYLLLYGLYLHDFLIWFPFTTTFSSLYPETLVLHLLCWWFIYQEYTVGENLNDNHWHTFNLRRHGNLVKMWVDDLTAKEGKLRGRIKSLWICVVILVL